MSKPAIWIDTDNALGAVQGDVDDGFAVAAVATAARRGLIDLIGVSVVNGNTDAATALHCTDQLLHVAGLDYLNIVPAEQAGAVIANLPIGTSVLALGPLTNIAAAIRLDPSCSARLELRIVAGVRSRLRNPMLALSDLNQTTDRLAAHCARAAAWQHLRIMTLDVIRALRIDRHGLDRIASTGSLGEYLRVHSERWLARAEWRYPIQRSFPVWDLVAAMDALHSLPGAGFDANSRVLTHFDAQATFAEFLSLLKS